MKQINIKLKKIDLNKTTQHKEGYFTEHPDIKLNKWYLACVGGNYAAGQFTKQWYGLNFDGFYDSGLQLDKPGTNLSEWQGLWEIIGK